MPKISTNKLVRLAHFCMSAPSSKNHNKKLTAGVLGWSTGVATTLWGLLNINIISIISISNIFGGLNINNIKDFGDLDPNDDMMTLTKLP